MGARSGERRNSSCQRGVHNICATTNIGCSTATATRTSTITATVPPARYRGLILRRMIVSATAANIYKQCFAGSYVQRCLNTTAQTTNCSSGLAALTTLCVNQNLRHSIRNFVRLNCFSKPKSICCRETCGFRNLCREIR